MKKIVFITLIISIAALLSTKTVKVVFFEKKPIIFTDRNGDVQGLAKDLITEAAENLNWDLIYESMPFSEALAKVVSGEADVMVPLAYTPQRDSLLNFSTIPVISSWGTVFSGKDDTIESIMDVDGKTIAYVKKSMFKNHFIEFAERFKIEFNLIEVESFQDMFDGIIKKEFDGGIGDNLLLQNLNYKFSQEINSSLVYHPFEMYIVSGKNSGEKIIETINQFMVNDDSKNSDNFNRIIENWKHSDHHHRIYSGNLILILSFLIIITCLFVLAHSELMREITCFNKLFSTKASLNTLFGGVSVAVFAWILDVLMVFFWFNNDKIHFVNLFLVKYDLHHMVLRIMSFFIIFIGSIIIALLIEKLSKDKTKFIVMADKLSTTLNSIGDAVITTDSQGRIDRINPIAELLTGWITDEAKGKSLTDVYKIYNALTGEPADSPVEKVLKEGKIVGIANHTLLKSRNGDEFQIADSAAPIRSKNGDINGVVLVFRDVTQDYKLHETIRKNEERFDKVLKTVPDLVSLHDKEMNIIFSNWNGVFNVPAVKRKSGTKCYKTYRNRDSICSECKVGKVLESKKPIQEEVNIGNNLWIDERILPIFDDKGEIEYIVELVSDISDRKLSELLIKESTNRLDLTLKGADLGSWDMDISRGTFVINERYAEMAGYKIDEVDNNPAFWKSLIHPDDLENVSQNFNNHINGLSDMFECELRLKHKSGKWIWVMDRGKLLSVSNDDKPARVCGTRLDITEKKKTEAVIKEKNKELENYLYVASHDLRSPLVNIQGFTDRISRHTYKVTEMVNTTCPELFGNEDFHDLSSVQIPQSMNFIFNNVKKMDILIKGLLKISRTGRAPVAIERINMNKLVQSTINSYNFEIEKNKIKVTIDDLPECFGDKNLLNQLFSNLISNCIKYRKRDENLKIKISAKDEGFFFNYHILDNGVGIKKRNIERIWNVFYRVGTFPEVEGEGLGLSIVKRISEKLKGQVNIKSEINKGTEVIVSLRKTYFE